ncbi:GSCOCG00011905001-RA-CDS, partial [Cotesia congregata]
GWFSVVTNNNHTSSARIYRKIGALVRAGVPAFLLAKPLRAYSLTHSKIVNSRLSASRTSLSVEISSKSKISIVGVSVLTVPMFAVADFTVSVKALLSSVFRDISRRTPPCFVFLIDFMSTPVSTGLTMALISLRRSAYVCSSAGWKSTALDLVFFLL